jgi:hypothetical protein
VETRRAEVLNQFKSNHPDFSADRIQNAQKNLEHEHFPIYIYKNMLVSPVGLLVFLLCTSCFIVPFLLLWYLRTNNRFRYAALNRDVLVSRIQSDYALAIEQGQRIQKTRYGLDPSVQPHKAWLDPPFNIHGIGEKPLYTFETEKEFEEYAETLPQWDSAKRPPQTVSKYDVAAEFDKFLKRMEKLREDGTIELRNKALLDVLEDTTAKYHARLVLGTAADESQVA